MVHPSYQVWSYAALIKDYNQTVQDQEIGIAPCAYLHNYQLRPSDPLLAHQYRTYIDDAPVFTSSDALKLRSFIKQHVRKGDQRKILYEIDNGKIRPSKSLQNAISSMIKGNREFVVNANEFLSHLLPNY